MFYISEEELKFKKDTNPEYFDKKLNHIFMKELFNLKNIYPFHDFVQITRNATLYFLNRTYLDETVVFFEDCSILKINFIGDGFEWSEHYDSEISTSFYYGRYSIRI
ncbi:hypothetical protein EGK75_13970 [Neisseria weixii]|uniref:Uncharacterized protein n=1 Tax=Neisseria weixii TaxID=1853276 RepID=A0A3N4MMU6_9NEIS|nr:hypothetical protein EGK74_14005 [Neisseria weixii]RPD83058.1 hypothetical protein EGK75_13970 [Neisseria weixii]